MKTSSSPHQILHVQQRILGRNAELANRNRSYFQKMGLWTVNILSSPGAGKTSLIECLLAHATWAAKCGVIVGDLARIKESLSALGLPMVQHDKEGNLLP